MLRKSRGSDNKIIVKDEILTFEKYSHEALNILYKAISNKDFIIACRILEDLAENLKYLAMYDNIILLDKQINIYADSMRESNNKCWSWYLNSLGIALSRLGYFEDANIKINEMLELGESLCDKDIKSTALQNLGVIHSRVGKNHEARLFYMLALEYKENIGDKRGLAQILNNLASINIDEGNYDEAELLLKRSIQLKRRLRDKEEILPAYGNLGRLAVSRKEYKKARKYFETTLNISKAINSLEDMAISHLNLGNVIMELGYGDEALLNYHKGIKIAEKYHLLNAKEMLIQATAVGYNKLGLFREAQEAFKSLAEIKRKLHKDFGEAMAFHDVAVVSEQLNESDIALYYYDRAIKYFRRLNNLEWEARTLSEKASLLIREGMISKAIRAVKLSVRNLRNKGNNELLMTAYATGVQILFQARLTKHAIILFKEELLFLENYSEDTYKANRLYGIGNKLLYLDQPRDAKPFLQEAIEIFNKIPDKTLEALTRCDLAMAYANLGDLKHAKSDYTELLELSEREDNRVIKLLVMTNLAEVERRDGNTNTAIDLGLKSLTLAKQINDTDSFAMILNNIGLAFEDMDNIRTARSYFKKSIHCAEQYQDKIAQARAMISLGNLDYVKARYKKALVSYKNAKNLIDDEVSELKLDTLELCLVCLIPLGCDEEASEMATQAIELADKICDFNRAEDIAMKIALANLEQNELEGCAKALLLSLNFALKQSHKSFLKNIVAWALLLREAEYKPYDSEAFYQVLINTLQTLPEENVAKITELLDNALYILNEQLND